ncbi:MAG: molybdate ABC transporter substrate-binding protein [Desulfovibrio sp.]|nr:molybdate ABC transporter substrate-binding protein [Desulfovibrio sp.]|tara:strand:+ start:18268 stop:19026 length:759 start_codon:yes stop_codon:yes gene_type:complete
MLSRILHILIALTMVTAVPATSHARELIVSAAASLTDAFSDIEPAFEAQHPGVNVIMNFASSGALYRQIQQGAPVDVYASANPKWMKKAVSKGFADESAVVVFARNSLVLATPKDNPANVTSVDDLKENGVQSIGIGTPETVPAGQYAKEALDTMKLYDALTTKMIYAESVRQVLDYLSRGEVDCGFVYRTDAVKADDTVSIITEIPLKAPVSYPIASLKNAEESKLAEDFVAFVQSEAGIKLLEGRGFKKP